MAGRAAVAGKRVASPVRGLIKPARRRTSPGCGTALLNSTPIRWIGSPRAIIAGGFNARFDDLNSRIDDLNSNVNSRMDEIETDIRELRALVIDAIKGETTADCPLSGYRFEVGGLCRLTGSRPPTACPACPRTVRDGPSPSSTATAARDES